MGLRPPPYAGEENGLETLYIYTEGEGTVAVEEAEGAEEAEEEEDDSCGRSRHFGRCWEGRVSSCK